MSYKCKIVLLLLVLLWGSPSSRGQKASYKGLYVDNFHKILGNRGAEDSLLSYAKYNRFTTLSLYHLHNVHNEYDITTVASSVILAKFINKARLQFQIPHITAIGENYQFFRDVIFKYNQIHTAIERFDAYNVEFEFWNTAASGPAAYYCSNYLAPNGYGCSVPGAYTFYIDQMRKIDSLANADHCLSETYLGWPDSAQVAGLMPYTDRILLHAYVTNPGLAYNYTKPRLKNFGSTKDTAKIIILFSSEPDFLGPWLATHVENDAYSIWKAAGYDAQQSTTWKEHTHVLGYQWFTYTEMPYKYGPASVAVKTKYELSCKQKDHRLEFNQPFTEHLSIGLYDLAGREVFKKRCLINEQSVDLPAFLSSAMYILRVNGSSINITERLFLH